MLVRRTSFESGDVNSDDHCCFFSVRRHCEASTISTSLMANDVTLTTVIYHARGNKHHLVTLIACFARTNKARGVNDQTNEPTESKSPQDHQTKSPTKSPIQTPYAART